MFKGLINAVTGEVGTGTERLRSTKNLVQQEQNEDSFHADHSPIRRRAVSFGDEFTPTKVDPVSRLKLVR